jgi:hypothetical protein
MLAHRRGPVNGIPLQAARPETISDNSKKRRELRVAASDDAADSSEDDPVLRNQLITVSDLSH